MKSSNVQSIFHRNFTRLGFSLVAIVSSVTLCLVLLEDVGAVSKSDIGKTHKVKKADSQSATYQEVDTLVATNHNVGNFKKGFFGDNLIAAVSNNPFYKLDIIARQGSQGFTNVFLGSTVSGNGSVLFAGTNAQGASVFVGDSVNPPRPIANPVSGVVYGGAVQLTDNNKSISWLSSQGTQSLTVRDSLFQALRRLSQPT